MPRWGKGADQIQAMLERRELQRVAGGADAALGLLDSADRHIETSRRALPNDAEGAYVLAYDASRKAATALLAQQGLRPTTRGGHIAAVEAIQAQFPGVPGLRSLDRLRRRRNQAEYPDPATYDPIDADEADDAIHTARTAVDTARTILDQTDLGPFR